VQRQARHVGVEQEERSTRKSDSAPHSEHPEGRYKGFGRHEAHTERDQRQARIVDGQEVEREQAYDERNAAHDSR
jgi:hypothetical protein